MKKPETCRGYYYVNLSADRKYSYNMWTNDKLDLMLFERGLIFETKEEVIAEAEISLKAIKMRRLNKDAILNHEKE